MKKNKKVLYIIISLILLVLITLLITFSNKFTRFYKGCLSLKEGMTKEEVITIMNNYIKDTNNFETSYEGALWGGGIYISKGNDHCDVRIRDNIVINIDSHFEP